jgi:hypothetical protein
MTDVRITTKAVFDSATGTFYPAGTAVELTEDMATVKKRGTREVVPGFDERSIVATETRVAGDKQSAVEAATKKAAGGKPVAKRKAVRKPKPVAAKAEAEDDETIVEEGGSSRGGPDKTNPLS